MAVLKLMPDPPRKQDATYWKAQGIGNDGRPKGYEAPVAIKCRWDDGSHQVLNADGEQVLAAATVYPNINMSEGDYLCLITLAEASVDPRDSKRAWPVVKMDRITDYDQREILYIAHL